MEAATVRERSAQLFRNESLVRGRPLHMIDHQNLYRALGRCQFQPELFL